MFELFLLAMLPLILVAALVIGVLFLLGPILGFLITLPFRILGFVLGLVGWVIAVPFIVVGGALAILGLLVGLFLGGLFLLLPLLPVVLVVMGLVWLVRRSRTRARVVAG